jgi:hypothetical protein
MDSCAGNFNLSQTWERTGTILDVKGPGSVCIGLEIFVGVRSTEYLMPSLHSRCPVRVRGPNFPNYRIRLSIYGLRNDRELINP